VKVLLINHYAGSERMGMEYRPFYLAREWVADGHSATIVAADFSHLRSCQPKVHSDLESTEEEGVRFRWVRTNSYGGNGSRRVLNMLAFSGKLLAQAIRVEREERPDIVICSSTYPLDIYPGARIARRAKARLVFEVHDLWPLTPILLGGYSRKHPYIAALQYAEDWAYRHADSVVSILPNTREYMVGRGLDPRKFVHVPNGISVASAMQRPDDDLPSVVRARIECERRRGRFLIGYAGGINLAMALETVLETSRIVACHGITFLVAGDGPAAAALRAQLERSRFDNFHLLGPIPKSNVQSFLSAMDALVIPWHQSPLYKFGISPNKVFDYMLAGKPIVQSSDAANDPVAEAECGLTVSPEDPAALAAAILRLHRLPHGESRRLGENGQRFVSRHHDYKFLARRFLQAVAANC
jgi:glycosyltransferase involved in cell wall biosynthesis